MWQSSVVGQVLAIVSPLLVAVSVYLAGNRQTLSWPLGILAQFIIGVYGVATHHWGWLISPLIVGPLFVRNWVKWRRESRVNC